MRDGTIKHSKDIDFSRESFWKDRTVEAGYYVYFGMWKGPFPSPEYAKDAYREWVWEARHS